MKKIAIISLDAYTIAKVKNPVKNAFANIKDKNEITSIFKENEKVQGIIKLEKGFKLITFDMLLPFTMTGFISEISTALAKQKIPIFVISAFTTDHILIKDKYLEKSNKVLKKLGFTIKWH